MHMQEKVFKFQNYLSQIRKILFTFSLLKTRLLIM